MLRKGGEKMSNEWLTINELSDRLKVSIKTVRNRMADGLPYHKIGGALRFDYDEIVEWIKVKKVKPAKNKNKSNDGLLVLIENDSPLSDDMKFILSDFIAMRKEIKKPLSQKGYGLLMKKLKELAKNEPDQIKILENSIMNSWQGIFPLKNSLSGNPIKDEFSEYEEFCKTQGIRAGKVAEIS